MLETTDLLLVAGGVPPKLLDDLPTIGTEE